MRLRCCGCCGLPGYLAIPQMRNDLNFVAKGQRMSEVVLDNQGSSDSRRRRSRVGLLLVTAVVFALLCKPLPAQMPVGQLPAREWWSSIHSGQHWTGDRTGYRRVAMPRHPPRVVMPRRWQCTRTTAQSGNAQAPAPRVAMPKRPRAGWQYPKPHQWCSSAPGSGPRVVTPATNRAEAPEDIPQEIQLPNPYGLLSLHDLYTQIPSAGGTLRRFGSDAFILGTGNANELPMDLPVGPDYVLGVGDNIAVNMWGGRSDRLSLTIDRQGQIALPEAGTITLDGLTIAQAQSAIQKALSTQFQDEHVEISLGRLRTVRVYVVGDVQRPGAFDVSSLSTPLSALYAAGGPTSRGSLRILRQYRGTQMVRQIDLYDFLLRGVRSNTDRLLPGDTILVPPVGPQVTVEGMVHRPAIYELNGETTLNQVLDLAGGVLATASLKQINVQRIEAHERRTMLNLQLPGNADAVNKEIAGFQVQGGDDVVISQILPYNQQAVYLVGHVYRPGKYPYRDGMTINDLLKSYQDVMPEPADHAELIRLQPPDFRPETISFSLPDVLIGNDAIPLQPFDLIRIYQPV